MYGIGLNVRIGLNVQLSDWLCDVSEPIRQLYIEADPYIEADSVHWGRIGLNVQYIEADLIYFLMWCVWANQTPVHWGRSHTLRPNLQSVCV